MVDLISTSYKPWCRLYIHPHHQANPGSYSIRLRNDLHQIPLRTIFLLTLPHLGNIPWTNSFATAGEKQQDVIERLKLQRAAARAVHRMRLSMMLQGPDVGTESLHRAPTPPAHSQRLSGCFRLDKLQPPSFALGFVCSERQESAGLSSTLLSWSLLVTKGVL